MQAPHGCVQMSSVMGMPSRVFYGVPGTRAGFFFSSRRRHTRSLCDWSSDVCSSDLTLEHLSRLGQIHFDKDDRASYERFIEADTAFHVGIAQLTRNPLLLKAVRDVRCHMERIKIGRASCRERR